MRRSTISVITICLAIGFIAMSPSIGWAQDATINVAPNVLVISSQGTKVTIHSNIPAGTVNVSTLELSIDGAGSLIPTATTGGEVRYAGSEGIRNCSEYCIDPCRDLLRWRELFRLRCDRGKGIAGPAVYCEGAVSSPGRLLFL